MPHHHHHRHFSSHFYSVANALAYAHATKMHHRPQVTICSLFEVKYCIYQSIAGGEHQTRTDSWTWIDSVSSYPQLELKGRVLVVGTFFIRQAQSILVRYYMYAATWLSIDLIQCEDLSNGMEILDDDLRTRSVDHLSHVSTGHPLRRHQTTKYST